EARLAKLATEMLRDIDAETVDFGPNYDESSAEPLVLPARFPNLLVNGSSGIAVGMATNIPPHNLGEVIGGVQAYLDDPEIDTEGLMAHIKGPDFPGGGTIMGSAGIRDAYRSGRGSVRVRAKAHIEPIKSGKEAIIVSELPFMVKKGGDGGLITKIADLVRDKKITEVSDLRDESDRSGMRLVIELKRDAIPKVALSKLYKHTQMQSSFGVNMVALVDNVPRTLSLKEMIHHYVGHQREVIIRRTQYQLRQAEARAHVLEGILIALDNLDAVIALIRASANPDEAREGLIEKFELTEIQAQAILDMRLQRLTGLERDKIVAEFQAVLATILDLKDILARPERVTAIVKAELLDIKERFGSPRRTEIVAESGDFDILDLIAEEEVVLTITRGGYAKRSPLSLYRAQKRGGKGRTGAGTKEEDLVEHLFVASTHDYLLVFTNKGRVHWVKVYDVPSLGPTTRGKALVNLIQVEPGEQVAAMATTREFPDDRYLLFATKNGLVKKTVLSAYGNPRQAGIIAINLEDGDELLSVHITDGARQVFLGTRNGMAIKFTETDVRPTGRDTTGVKGIELKNGDVVVEMDLVDENGRVLAVTEFGYGKQTAASEYRHQTRGGSGVINVKITEKNGPVVGLKTVSEGDQLLLITEQGILIRFATKDVRETGRSAVGVRLIDLDPGDKVVAVAKLAERDEDVDAAAPLAPPDSTDPSSEPEPETPNSSGTATPGKPETET
ncbi:MAG: DNA gyrase subunit A, partial [Thermoanaerobaculia bacterium]